jgi:predicted O-methyltransferase YrrM
MNRLKDTAKQFVHSILLTFPYFKKVYNAYRDSGCFLPGHYYSTIPSLDYIEKNQERIFSNENINNIRLRLDEQYQLLEELKNYYHTIPYQFNYPKANHFRYKSEGAFYRFSDVIFLSCIMRHFKPKRIIEIGSGHSSAVMLDTNEMFFQNEIKLTFIEPYPQDRLNSVLRKEDEQVASLIQGFVQDVTLDVFQQLEDNDILFVDSSHVSKAGSDVNYIIFDILPALKPGVLIHFHDIFFPFELPKQLILARFFWNENYLLRAFLMNNDDFDIVLFNTLLQRKNRAWFEKWMPACLIESENTGAIWIRKCNA